MKIVKNRILAITIGLILVFSMSASAILLPSASAHTPPNNIVTDAYVNVTPNPAGVNQSVLIVMWIENLNPSANGITGDRWQNYTITVTAPN